MLNSFLMIPLISVLVLNACHSLQPNRDYALAHSSLLTAKIFSADKIVPKDYSKGLNLYKKAVSYYKKKDYEKATLFFADSIRFAEQAEFKARKKQKEEDME